MAWLRAWSAGLATTLSTLPATSLARAASEWAPSGKLMTSTDHAPWFVVPADRNWVKAVAVAELLVEALERIDPQLPEPEEGLEGLVIE